MIRLPAFAIAALAAVAPALAVGQFRALALVVTVGLVATVLADRRLHGRWPWPRGAAVAAAMLLFGWLAVSALWAAEPGRAVATAAALGGFVLLGAAAARAVATDAASPRLGVVLAIGVAIGGTLAAIDQLSGHALRAAVRGLAVPTPTLGFGLKPAVSLLAMLLPLALFLPGTPRWLRFVAVPAATAALWLVPAEAAKLAALAGIAAALLAVRFGAVVVRGIAALAAVAILAAPLLTAAIVPRLPPLETWPRTAAHRVLIWDFAAQRIGERPLLGWGGEAARSIPGGQDNFAPATLARFGLDSKDARDWFARPAAQQLPLHVHNMALQLWLELGGVGALLGAALVLALGRAASRTLAPAAAAGGFAAAATVGGLSFGLWQEWWWGALLLVCCLLAQRAASPAKTSPSAG